MTSRSKGGIWPLCIGLFKGVVSKVNKVTSLLKGPRWKQNAKKIRTNRTANSQVILTGFQSKNPYLYGVKAPHDSLDLVQRFGKLSINIALKFVRESCLKINSYKTDNIFAFKRYKQLNTLEENSWVSRPWYTT